MAARHRVSKLLLRQGIVYYGGKAWTAKHEQWLRTHRFDAPGLQLAYDAAFDAMLATVDRRDRLDAAICAMAADSVFTPVVTRLGCLRGISTGSTTTKTSPRTTPLNPVPRDPRPSYERAH